MKHSRTPAAVALLCALLASCSIKQVEYNKRTVTVHGTGSVTLEADTATIILSVITRAKDVAGASTDNAIKMNDVQNAVQRAGIGKDYISTENYSIFQESSYDAKGKQIMGDYRVTNQIKITVKDISMVSNIIDTALSAGANELASLEYGVSSTELAAKQARTLAVQQAQESAALIAGTSGTRLGKVLSITEQPSASYPRASFMKASALTLSDATAPVATPVSAGKTVVTVNVDAVFELN